MMTPFARPVAALTGIALVALGVWRGLDCPTGTAGPPAPSAGLAQVTIYDPDPQHLWNRLHRALWVRTGRDGKEYGHDRLDPLLWSETKHLLQGNSHEQAVAVLDEFLAEHGEKLVKDPLKRAILQRDLWAKVLETVDVHNIAAAADVRGSGELAGALGEGFADGLDVAGF